MSDVDVKESGRVESPGARPRGARAKTKPDAEESEPAIAAQIARLHQMKTGQLRERYAEVFGEPSRSRNKQFLIRKIAYRIQEQAFGGVPEEVKKRAREIAEEHPYKPKGRGHAVGDARFSSSVGPAASRAPSVAKSRDRRLPAVGSILEREFHGRVHRVVVGPSGFEYEGKHFKSLSGVARLIAGCAWNGYGFFNLLEPRNEG